MTVLGLIYKDCKRLFKDYLDIEDAGIGHVVDALCWLNTGAEDALRVFHRLMILLQDLSTISPLRREDMYRMWNCSIFPVVESKHASTSNMSKRKITWSGLNEIGWYIPNSTALHSVFHGKVDLLHLSVESVHSIKSILITLGCEHLFLSANVTESSDITGSQMRDWLEEKSLHRRLEYIAWFVKPNPSEHENITNKKIAF